MTVNLPFMCSPADNESHRSAPEEGAEDTAMHHATHAALSKSLCQQILALHRQQRKSAVRQNITSPIVVSYLWVHSISREMPANREGYTRDIKAITCIVHHCLHVCGLHDCQYAVHPFSHSQHPTSPGGRECGLASSTAAHFSFVYPPTAYISCGRCSPDVRTRVADGS